MTPLRIAGAASAAVIAIIALVLFVIGIPSGLVNSAIQDRVERETGYRIIVSGATRFGLGSALTVTAHDIAVRDPNARDSVFRAELGSAQVGLAYRSVLSGNPKVTRLAVNRPVVHIPLHRDRSRQPNPPSSKPASSKSDVPAHMVVTDGTLVFVHRRDNVETRIEAVSADFKMGADRKIRMTGNGRASAGPLKYELRAIAPPPPLERQNIPVELTVEAPGHLHDLLTAKAEMRVNGSVLMVNGLTGKIGSDEFNGWASADFASKPLVKLDLDFQRLQLGTPGPHAAAGPQQGWSDRLIDVHGLNYLDAQIRVSAAELRYGDAVFAPAAIDASIADGLLKAQFSQLGVYGGVADGDFSIDAATANTGYTLRGDLQNVRALPLLKGLADFEKLDGKLQAKIALQASGTTQRAIMSSLAGTVFTNFEDGAIQGLNLAKMIRSLTSGTLSGWQEGNEQTTDLTQLSASFRIERGQATNTDLALLGPLVRMTGTGIVDLPAKSLTFRVEPKLVMSTEGQGSAANPVGLGVPVMVEGPWSAPHIYPDMAGILNDPKGAYAKLKEMGKGLFGRMGTSDAPGTPSSGAMGGSLRETLGTFLQQGLGRDPAAAGGQPPAPASPPGQGGNTPPPPSETESMQQILKNLFNR
jgi:AsmA protein